MKVIDLTLYRGLSGPQKRTTWEIGSQTPTDKVDLVMPTQTRYVRCQAMNDQGWVVIDQEGGSVVRFQ